MSPPVPDSLDRLAGRKRLFVVLRFAVAAVQANYVVGGSLGMIYMQQRAALAQSDVVVDSKPGVGTNFPVRVPLSQ